jgi:toxin HigB-1
VIKPCKDQETQQIFTRQRSRRLPPEIQQVALRKLRMLNNEHALNDLQVPSAHRLEKLAGDWAGQYSIQLNDRWRVCFAWRDGDTDAVLLRVSGELAWAGDRQRGGGRSMRIPCQGLGRLERKTLG